MNRAQQICGIPSSIWNIHNTILELRKGEGNNIWWNGFRKLHKFDEKINVDIWEAQWTQDRLNSEGSTPVHKTVRLLRQRNRILKMSKKGLLAGEPWLRLSIKKISSWFLIRIYGSQKGNRMKYYSTEWKTVSQTTIANKTIHHKHKIIKMFPYK